MVNSTGNTFVAIFAVLIIAAILALYIWSLVWAVSDAEKRGKSGCLVALMVLLLPWPVGLIIWLLIRPTI